MNEDCNKLGWLKEWKISKICVCSGNSVWNFSEQLLEGCNSKMTRLVLYNIYGKLIGSVVIFGNWQKRGEGCHFDWFSLCSHLSQSTQLFGNIWTNLDFQYEYMIWCWVHYDDDDLIQWYRFLIRTLFRSREYSGPTAASEFWTGPSGTGEQSVEEDYSLYKSSGSRDLQSYSRGLGTEIIKLLRINLSWFLVNKLLLDMSKVRLIAK